MEFPVADYALEDASCIITPALLIYPELVESNIAVTLHTMGGDANRWRPHIKTAKLGAVVQSLLRNGVRQFKCSTTLELLTACQAGADDVLLAFAVVGANAERVFEISKQYPRTRISVLVESAAQALLWKGGQVGVFLDLNSGMNRTGLGQDDFSEIRELARGLGSAFRGLHWYDGHISGPPTDERRQQAHEGYERLLKIESELKQAGLSVEEVITSGTPASPYGLSYPGFTDGRFTHRISPGTVVYNDMSSLKQLPGFGYRPAALVLTSVISHPLPNRITCDAGHKAVSADAGVPTCEVLGHPNLTPLKPSEEHLPMEADEGSAVPTIGAKLYLLPRHVCPTVNNFDQALMVVGGRILGVERVTARGHESPLAAGASDDHLRLAGGTMPHILA